MSINEYTGIYALYKIGCAFIPAMVVAGLASIGSVCTFVDKYCNEEPISNGLKNMALVSTIFFMICCGFVIATPSKSEVENYEKLLSK